MDYDLIRPQELLEKLRSKMANSDSKQTKTIIDGLLEEYEKWLAANFAYDEELVPEFYGLSLSRELLEEVLQSMDATQARRLSEMDSVFYEKYVTPESTQKRTFLPRYKEATGVEDRSFWWTYSKT